MAQNHNNSAQGRRFVFTLNNYSDTDIHHLSNLAIENGLSPAGSTSGITTRPLVGDVPTQSRTRSNVAYLCFQQELGAQGTPHLQGYIRFSTKKTRLQVSKLIPHAHIEIAKGTDEQCRDYCSKLDTSIPDSFKEWGSMPAPGTRTDLATFATTIKTGISGKRLFEAHPDEYLKFGAMAQRVSTYYAKKRSSKTTVVWCWGATGTGKTKYIHSIAPDAYWKSPITKWWCGYDPSIEGHAAIIIDDFRRDFSTFAELLRLFDRYPHTVEGKGTNLQFTATHIYVTSPLPPDLVWHGRTAEDIQQLLRRVDEIRYFSIGGPENGITEGEAYTTAYNTATARIHTEAMGRVH